MATVNLDGLTKIYDKGHAPAAEDVSLDIAHGEFMVLLGPSGCGKTTTLRMIAGLESISAGHLSIDDAIVNNVPARDRDIAMVFQSYALYPHMTVKNNLAFGLRRRKVAKAEIETRVRSVAETLELDTLLDRKPHALSGGQRQRVALGRAIVRDPKVFLFDEPLSNLDAALRVSTRAEIADLHRRLGATMIYVTHDQVEAMTLGTRICIMNGGRVMQVGRPLDVYRRPENTFVASFLGNPPMNLMPATVTDDSGGRQLSIGEISVEIPAGRVAPMQTGAAVTLGIRPENVAISAGSDTSSGSLKGSVVQIEALGAETIAMFQLPRIGQTLTARMPGDAGLEIGDESNLSFDRDAIHVFDSEGQSLLNQEP